MWHEARKQERRIRGLIVDYRRRAERRQDFYEKIQADPTQFIQIHGRRCKIHLDPAVSAAGDGAAIIVPWQGQSDNLIDRFDVRAHLDYIPAIPKNPDNIVDISQDERHCNYERYRILAQNDFLNVTEEKFLHQLYLEEQFGVNAPIETQSNQSKKKTQKAGAAIGYSYDDSAENAQESQHFAHVKHSTAVGGAAGPLPTSISAVTKNTEDDSESDSDSDMDMDVSIEVSKLDTNQAHELNACGRNYGMLSNDFYSYLTKDADEADALRMAREEEREKILLGGRKSRRERRAQKERRIARRPFSPPSYAAKEDHIGKDEDSDSRSPSPSDTTEKITYITSFGGEDELQPHSKITITLGRGSSTLGAACVGASTSSASGEATYAQKVKENLEKLKQFNPSAKRRNSRSQSYSRGRSHSRTLRRSHRSARRSRSRSSSYNRHRKIDKRSVSRSHSRSRSRSVNKFRGSYMRRHREGYKRSLTRSDSRSHSISRSRRRRYHSSLSSSTGRSTVSPLRTNYKSTKKTKHSPKSLSRRTRSPSRSNTRRSKATDIKEKSKSPYSIIEITSTKQTDVLMSSITQTSPQKIALTNTSQPASTPIDSVANKQILAMVNVIEAPPPPLKRYYGRKKHEYSSSDNNSDSDNVDENNALQVLKTKDASDTQDPMDVDTTSEKSNPLPSTSVLSYKGKSQQQPPQTGKYGSNTSNSNAPETKGFSGSGVGGGSSGSVRLNLRERLKRKMQNLLNKQYKADKKAEIEKTERERQLQQEREEEMRELSIKLRKRQRELRHRYGSQNSKESESDNSDIALTTRSKRSKSPSSERSSAKISRRHSPERKHNLKSPLRAKRSSSHDRRRSPSHSNRHPKSRSQSRSRRSNSKRRRRSVSRSRRHREPSRERSSRYNTERLRYNDRFRRSVSRGERDRDRDRDRIRYRDRDRDSDRQRYRGTCSASDRYRSDRGSDGHERSDRDRHRDRQQSASTATTSSASLGTTSRSRVVISAPPKLKKLVDY